MKYHISFSTVFLAALIFLVLLVTESQAKSTRRDLCRSASYKPLCRATLRGISDPRKAIEASIKRAIFKTKSAIVMSRKMRRNENYDICRENYDDAISDLQDSIRNLRKGDKATLTTNLSAVISYYSTCDDAFEEMDEKSPLTRANMILEHMVDNALSIVPLMR
ncbi:putative pectinesterase/pectinesterase inhibitor 45 [Mercurialis annua]|uniref:putative pectinesterase/pectinesterase inhibitor 45 n=1 Tax=Mercurialis annua TaxID=3986 RepID=UPI00215EE273|nr:putative pectinesterase/pectinesterase inhibitor 45 [Mercurialis annua]